MASNPYYKNAIINARIRNDDVTGSSIELNICDDGIKSKFIIDKGLFLAQNEQNRNFTEETYDDVSAVFLTHAHVDHCGQIPHMCKNGLKAPIYMSKQTAQISQALIRDEFFVLEQSGIEITQEDERSFRKMINLTKTVTCEDNIRFPNATVTFVENAHVLGANMVYLKTKNSKTNMHLLVTGDYRDEHPFIKKKGIAGFIKNNPIDVMFMEATYGGRQEHPCFKEAICELENLITKTIQGGGNALIPVFSFDRTQVILYALTVIQANNPEFRKIPIYADGKLMQYLTSVYNQNANLFNVKQKNIMPKNLFNIVGSKQRREVFNDTTPKIILATSGQMHSGAIVPHILHYIDDPKTAIISVGYVGHKIGKDILELPEGSTIMYSGNEKEIKCKRYQINGFSAHGDMLQLANLVSRVKKYNTNLKLVLYHGTAQAKKDLKKYIVEQGILDSDSIYIPRSDDKIVINKCTIKKDNTNLVEKNSYKKD